MKKIRKSLPSKPSVLIRLALDDLNEVERLDGYHVNMGVWHDPVADIEANYNNEGSLYLTCNVCLAGAVMARTLGKEFDEYSDPSSFKHTTNLKLSALDLFRKGAVSEAFELLGKSYNVGLWYNRAIASYRDDKRRFKLDMRQLCRDLAKDGM